MPDRSYPDPREEDIVFDDRRISRPDASLPDWESPDTTYRPVPIVWFAGALILQAIAQPLVFGVLGSVLGLQRYFVVAAALVASALIWHITMERGMASASRGWRISLGIMLSSLFALTALTALA